MRVVGEREQPGDHRDVGEYEEQIDHGGRKLLQPHSTPRRFRRRKGYLASVARKLANASICICESFLPKSDGITFGR